MIIGVPKEIKNRESRVALTPSGVNTLTNNGHKVLVEASAGEGSGFSDKMYADAGAIIVFEPKTAWKAEMVIKVKEPLSTEYKYFREGLILYTYLHLAAEKELTKALLDNKVVSIAYETIQLGDGSLPLLAPMSEVAGRLGVIEGAYYLKKTHGGKGVLLSGVPGVERSNTVIIGGGVAGTNAAKMAIGLGSNVTIIDNNLERLRYLDDVFGEKIKTIYSTPVNISNALKNASLVIGSVLIPGEKAPYLVTEDMVKDMTPGSVLVDIAIDQGGCFETTTGPTTHDNPTYIVHDVVHYSVANMPGAVSQTATLALTNATLMYGLEIANKGWKKASRESEPLLKGLNTINGYVTNKAVSKSIESDYKNPQEFV